MSGALPGHIGGYQHLEPDIFTQEGDIYVYRGKPLEFVVRYLGKTVAEAEKISGANVYRKIPVAKQGDAARAAGDVQTDAARRRKGIPVATGFLDYFPKAVTAVAELSRIGNDQHNPGTPLHWDRSKSGDESDALMRHFLERGAVDADGVPHVVKVAWRAMAMAEKYLEQHAQ